MSKKNRPPPHTPTTPAPKKRLRVEELPWSSSVPGVLGEAMTRNTLHGFSEVVVIGVRQDGAMDVLTSSRDRFRLMGIVRAALDLVARPRL